MKHFNIYLLEDDDFHAENANYTVNGTRIAGDMKALTVDLNPECRQRIVSKGCVLYMNNGNLKYTIEGTDTKTDISNGECLSLEPGEVAIISNPTPYPSNYLIIGNI